MRNDVTNEKKRTNLNYKIIGKSQIFKIDLIQIDTDSSNNIQNEIKTHRELPGGFHKFMKDSKKKESKYEYSDFSPFVPNINSLTNRKNLKIGLYQERTTSRSILSNNGGDENADPNIKIASRLNLSKNIKL